MQKITTFFKKEEHSLWLSHRIFCMTMLVEL
jgi:hypothetical protein